ncbi:HAD family hydrolase [Miniphocaeibacter massiliensis]|uniref:HAD family hydrolase n=1 Tax=Miniphocaeibacter massiliensis TaxID=2041841 RepID=UPI000C1B7E5D|nr:HAD family hydrolase [Miniphocaeibacter massiliensis]
MFKTILFDIDGTIIDTEYVMTKSLQKTLLEEKELSVSIKELNYILGIPGREALEKFTKNKRELNYLLEKWSENVLLFSKHATIFPQITEVLQALNSRNITLGVVTSKTKEEMKNEFDIFKLNHHFKIQVTASDTKLHKPNPEPIQKAIDDLGANIEETIYIGDSLYDMKSAKACGISFGLAKWGALESIVFNNVDFHLKTPKDILNLPLKII